jgi:hypothetical protein
LKLVVCVYRRSVGVYIQGVCGCITRESNKRSGHVEAASALGIQGGGEGVRQGDSDEVSQRPRRKILERGSKKIS